MLEDGTFTAADLMTRDVATVTPQTPLRDAVALMASRHVSGLPVVDNDGALVGMLCEGDLVRWHEGYSQRQARWLDMLADGFALSQDFLEGMRSEQNRVRGVMTSGVVTVTEDTHASQIAGLMHDKHIKRVPVVRDGRLVGIVARSDLVRALAMKLADQAQAAPAAAASVDEALRRRREEIRR